MSSVSEPWQPSGARWISMADCENAVNLYLEFARRFTCDASAALALEITAVSHYQAAVNGEIIGRGPAVSAPPHYYFHRYQIPADRLVAGENLITVLLFHDGEPTRTVQGFQYGRPGLLVRLSGPGAELVSDSSWRVRRSVVYSPRATLVSNWGTYKEWYHGEKADDWRSPACDHSGWDAAVEVADAISAGFVQKLVELDVPELEQTLLTPERIAAAAASLGRLRLPAGAADLPAAWTGEPILVAPGEPLARPEITLDFGRMVVGHPEIEVEGAGCLFEVWYGESLDMARLDVVRLPAGGTWQAFQRRAFRFLKIAFIALEGEVTLKRVAHHNTWYAFDSRGRLETSDPFINRVAEVSLYTLRANTSFHYEDCPYRELALWIMDMRIMSLLNYYLCGNPELTAKCLRQSFAIQRNDGSIASTGPKDNAMYHVDFLCHLVATLHEYYRYTGDRDLVAELAPALGRLHDWILTYRDEDGLLDNDRSRRGVFLDWSDRIEKDGKSTILNSLYKRYLEDLAALRELLGEPAPARQHLEEAQRVGGAINDFLFWEDAGLYRDACVAGELRPTLSQQANLAAIAAGIVPGERIPSIMEKVWDSDAYPRPFGPSYYLIVFDALARIGRYDAMIDIIRSYWGAMLERGATTWWEVFDPSSPEWVYPHPFLGATPTYEMDWIPISACHGWSGVPGYAIPRYLLGIDLLQLHRGRIEIRPGLPGHFERVDYAVPVKDGLLRVSFRGDGGRYAVEVREAPEGIEVVCV